MEELYYEGRREELLDQRPARAELPVEDLIQNWRALKTLKISSHCHPDYVRLILGKCVGLRDLEIGRAVDMSDWDFSQIFSKGDSSSTMMMVGDDDYDNDDNDDIDDYDDDVYDDDDDDVDDDVDDDDDDDGDYDNAGTNFSKDQFSSLQSFYMKESENPRLTIATVEIILDSCPNLRSLTDIRWAQLNEKFSYFFFSKYFQELVRCVSERGEGAAPEIKVQQLGPSSRGGSPGSLRGRPAQGWAKGEVRQTERAVRRHGHDSLISIPFFFVYQ